VGLEERTSSSIARKIFGAKSTHANTIHDYRYISQIEQKRALPSEISAGSASVGLDERTSSSIARKIFGAKSATQRRSQRKVPAMEIPTRDMTFQRNSSLGKGSRWINVLSSGKAPHAQTAHLHNEMNWVIHIDLYIFISTDGKRIYICVCVYI